MSLSLSNKKITKFYRTSSLISFLFSKNYVIFVNFLNESALQQFKKLINQIGFVDVFFINNFLKKNISKINLHLYTQLSNKKLFIKKNKWMLQGGLHAIICYDLKMVEQVLMLFSTTNFYKERYFSLFQNNVSKTIKSLNLNLGFITHIKFQSYFFNFNTKFLNFFFSLKNEYCLIKNNIFSRQIVTTTIWLFKSLIMISLKIFIFLITCFFFLIKQLLLCLFYANKKSIKS